MLRILLLILGFSKAPDINKYRTSFVIFKVASFNRSAAPFDKILIVLVSVAKTPFLCWWDLQVVILSGRINIIDIFGISIFKCLLHPA
jgi:hypothetical protein